MHSYTYTHWRIFLLTSFFLFFWLSSISSSSPPFFLLLLFLSLSVGLCVYVLSILPHRTLRLSSHHYIMLVCVCMSMRLLFPSAPPFIYGSLFHLSNFSHLPPHPPPHTTTFNTLVCVQAVQHRAVLDALEPVSHGAKQKLRSAAKQEGLTLMLWGWVGKENGHSVIGICWRWRDTIGITAISKSFSVSFQCVLY